MKTTERCRFIDDLTKVINYHVQEHSLFSGGCCYSAYLLAKTLRMFGIKYKTVIFQYDDILNETDFNNAINGEGVSHVAIEVRRGLKKYIIGDCSGIYRYFEWSGEKFKVMKYTDITPEEILDGYRNNEWNYTYDVHNNSILSRDINRVVAKYLSGDCGLR